MRVALFIPCYVDATDPETGMATARLLERLGNRVEYPEAQTCCGQPALNAGHLDLYELTEFLTEKLDVTDVGARFPGRVTWHDACHPMRELVIRDGPRRLLAGVEGLTLVEMGEAGECCGFGGLFSVKLPEVSVGMGGRKVASIEASGADWVASTESSCLMHIDGLLRRRGSRARAIHIARILAGEPA
jgi:L-lactate dehydrogenase complex protein LldE